MAPVRPVFLRSSVLWKEKKQANHRTFYALGAVLLFVIVIAVAYLWPSWK